MSDPFILANITELIVKNAPFWLAALGSTLLDKAKEIAIDKGKDFVVDKSSNYVGRLIRPPRKEQLRHLEQALENATERGIAKFHTLEQRDHYRAILETLFQSDPDSETLCQEALRLFTLSDSPDFTALSEKYNRRQCISAAAQNKAYTDIDTAPYLTDFFDALVAELYADPYFKAQMSEVLGLRASVNMQKSLLEVVDVLRQIGGTLADNYTAEQFARDVETYREHIKRAFHYLKIVSVVPIGQSKDPELDGIFVPLRIALRDQTTAEEQVESSIIDMLEHHPYLVLLGKPGSGKSTATRHLAWSHAVANQDTSSASTSPLLSGNPLPLRIELLRLTEDRRQHGDYDFLSYATEVMLGREGVKINQQMFRELLKRRAMLLLFDGLDELATLDERNRLVEEIESFARDYPGNRIVVTSRLVGYDLGSLSNQLFSHAIVQDFNDEQIWQFLENWYTYVLRLSPIPYQEQQEIETLFKRLKENRRLHKLAENPLLLTVITPMYRSVRLPDKRVQVYDRCAEYLLETWTRLKGTKARWKDIKMGKEDQYACVAHLGFVLHERSQEREGDSADRPEDIATDVPTTSMLQGIVRFLNGRKLIAEVVEQHTEAERFLELMQVEAGLIVERGKNESGENLYGFVHRTFQEYFAAGHVYTDYLQEENPDIITKFLKEHLHSPHWHEVILLLLGKLMSKPVTGKLRQILHGEIKSHRSHHTDVVQQDLFFVCECLVEEIAVESDLAKDVISLLSNLVKYSPFPSQRKEALDYLASLMQTRQYASLARRELITVITEEATSDIDTRIKAAATLYLRSPLGSKERQAIQVLSDLVGHPDLTIEQQIQAAETLYQCSLSSPEEGQPTVQMLSHLAQRPDLTIEQQIQVAEALHRYSLSSSKERQQAIRMLSLLAQHPDLTIEQQVQVAAASCRCSPAHSKERQQTVQKLSDLTQHPDLSSEQQAQVAEVLRECSLISSEEERRAARIFSRLTRYSDLSIEQQVQVADALYHCSFPSSEEERQATQVLSHLAQRSDLAIEQQVRAAEALYRCSPARSKEEQRAFQKLSDLAQHSDLTIEQQVQAAEALYRYNYSFAPIREQHIQRLLDLSQYPDLSIELQVEIAATLYRHNPSSSKERRQAVRKLLDLAERSDLILEQQVQVAEALYRCSPSSSKVRRQQAAQILLRLAQRPDLTIKQRQQVVEVFYRNNSPVSREYRQVVQILLDLTQRSDLTIEQQVQIMAAFYRHRPHILQEERQAIQELSDLTQRPGLSIEQQVQIAETLYRSSFSSSKEEQQAVEWLSHLAQHSDLTIEQQVQVAEARYQCSFPSSEEERQATQVLSHLAQHSDLTIEQQVQVAEALYRCSLSSSEEERQAFQMLSRLAQNDSLTTNQRRQAIRVLLAAGTANYSDKIQAVRMTLALLQGKDAKQYFEEHWQVTHSEPAKLDASDIPYIVELTKQDALPTRMRDDMYQILRQMVPQFGSS